MEAPEFAIIYVICSGLEEAKKIAGKVLDQRLAACANIVSPIYSLYWWKEKIEEAQETLLLLKAPYGYYQEIEKVVRANHSYEVPAILRLPITEGLPEYLRWLAQETNFDY
ncbi:MAG: divalent-cation tolerance protein CutA [Bacteroidia bacterium]|nr:divalent-cation tolerance protein CutA [Bacteroidia bacterium]MDW8133553.1 divalent-cation tolerance protein CutA [Bacteroidia bacterium]